jgi:hypothetical protein
MPLWMFGVTFLATSRDSGALSIYKGLVFSLASSKQKKLYRGLANGHNSTATSWAA